MGWGKILSVSIAAYNVEDTLREALEPFLTCTYREKLDIMIINDGSTDGTEKIAKEYVAKAPSVFRLINKENGGWGSTLNVGIARARGKYFKQLDGDDKFSEGTLDEFILFLERAQGELICSPYMTFDHETGKHFRTVGKIHGLADGQIISLSELPEFELAMHGVAVRTELLQKSDIRITEKCFYTDVEYVLKVCNLCENMQYYDKAVYLYRVARDGQSMSLSGLQKHYKEYQQVLFTMLEYEKTRVQRAEIHKLYRHRLEGLCSTQYAIYMALRCTPEHKRELQAFDAKLKEKWPEFYDVDSGRLIGFLKRHDFMGYALIGPLKTWRDKRLRRNLFAR